MFGVGFFWIVVFVCVLSWGFGVVWCGGFGGVGVVRWVWVVVVDVMVGLGDVVVVLCGFKCVVVGGVVVGVGVGVFWGVVLGVFVLLVCVLLNGVFFFCVCLWILVCECLIVVWLFFLRVVRVLLVFWFVCFVFRWCRF